MQKLKIINKTIITFILSFIVLINFSLAQSSGIVDTSGNSPSLVNCATSEVERPCTLDDLIVTMSATASFIITVILPVVFFYGLFMTIWPLFKGPDNPVNIAEAKSRFVKLLIGTAIVAGAYMIVRAALIAIGVNQTDNLKKAIGVNNLNSTHLNLLSFISEKAYAQEYDALGNYISNTITSYEEPASTQTQSSQGTQSSQNQTPISQTQNQNTSSSKFENPLANTSVQGVLSGIINAVTFIAILGNIYMYFRSGFLFLNGQQSSENLLRARKWLWWSIVVSLVIFGAQTIFTTIYETVKSVFTT